MKNVNVFKYQYRKQSETLDRIMIRDFHFVGVIRGKPILLPIALDNKASCFRTQCVPYVVKTLFCLSYHQNLSLGGIIRNINTKVDYIHLLEFGNDTYIGNVMKLGYYIIIVYIYIFVTIKTLYVSDFFLCFRLQHNVIFENCLVLQ